MQDVLKSLNNYVEHSEHITKRMKQMQEYKNIEKEERLELKAERLESVQKSLKKQNDELERRKAKIRKTEKEKARQI